MAVLNVNERREVSVKARPWRNGATDEVSSIELHWGMHEGLNLTMDEARKVHRDMGKLLAEKPKERST